MRLAVFDFDGTIVDSQHLIIAAVEAAWRESGMPPPPAAEIRRVVGLSLIEALARLHPEADTAAHAALAEHYKAAFFELRAAQASFEPLYPGIEAALAGLEDAGFLLGIATGKGLKGLTTVLDHYELADRFVTLQTPDHAPGKPHPRMLERAMEETGTRSRDCVMIGDTTYDMEMARNAGVAAIGVGWGYHDTEELAAAGARAVVADTGELADTVGALWAEA